MKLCPKKINVSTSRLGEHSGHTTVPVQPVRHTSQRRLGTVKHAFVGYLQTVNWANYVLRIDRFLVIEIKLPILKALMEINQMLPS